MIVPKNRLAEVEALAIETANAIIVGDPQSENTVLGPIANEAQFHRVQAMIEAGLGEGAKLLCGGPGRVEGFEKGFYARPTVFSDVNTSMRIAQEEIFGPVLCLIAYETVDEAVAIANDTVYGLGAHVQSQDLQQARAVASRIRAGQCSSTTRPGTRWHRSAATNAPATGASTGCKGLRSIWRPRQLSGLARSKHASVRFSRNRLHTDRAHALRSSLYTSPQDAQNGGQNVSI